LVLIDRPRKAPITGRSDAGAAPLRRTPAQRNRTNELYITPHIMSRKSANCFWPRNAPIWHHLPSQRETHCSWLRRRGARGRFGTAHLTTLHESIVAST